MKQSQTRYIAIQKITQRDFETYLSFVDERNFFRVFFKQASAFLNFRLPHPDSDYNIKKVCQYLSIKPIRQNHFENLQERFFIFENDDLDKLDNVLKEFFDATVRVWSPDDPIVFIGMSGVSGPKKGPVFKKSKFDLYDHTVHMPLLIFHPEFKPCDAGHSVSLDMVLGEKPIFDIINKHGQRSDIFNFFNDENYLYCGYRGPMFQYYGKFDNRLKPIAEEFYDLNNDLEMNNSMISKFDKINKMYKRAYDEYQKRSINYLREKFDGLESFV